MQLHKLKKAALTSAKAGSQCCFLRNNRHFAKMCRKFEKKRKNTGQE
ncbi:hypothetical protein CLOHYLEM_07752 [[Clostridium] hylemonae DSM 15053]|uniref:Uncharacterized protein n=1 Tax=[Clostridium] hylemonae DSM 15053 TaxID=553973 RepID=C0C6L4_9FIRM|nr:hypothetical protein CLOHYLEM_07752 [[Clostridium] hylemonae DSM 15053]